MVKKEDFRLEIKLMENRPKGKIIKFMHVIGYEIQETVGLIHRVGLIINGDDQIKEKNVLSP